MHLQKGHAGRFGVLQTSQPNFFPWEDYGANLSQKKACEEECDWQHLGQIYQGQISCDQPDTLLWWNELLCSQGDSSDYCLPWLHLASCMVCHCFCWQIGINPQPVCIWHSGRGRGWYYGEQGCHSERFWEMNQQKPLKVQQRQVPNLASGKE